MFAGFRPSVFIAALIAALVGFGGTVAIVIDAAAALGATQAQTASWIAGLGLGIAVNASILSYIFKKPITTAWSSPGAALIAATSGIGLTDAVGAFLLCALLLLMTAAIGRLRTLVAAIPMPLASALLAGVLFGYVSKVFPSIGDNPWLCLPMIALFLTVRLWSPAWATLATLGFGIALAFGLGQAQSVPPFAVTQLTFIQPTFNPSVLISLGLPLYLVTMAGQNLPGVAVLRASGYEVDTRPILGLTGLTSAALAFICAHTQNLAAITAAMCTGPEAHPDKDKRWMTGPALGAIYLVIALTCGWLVALFAALPGALIITVAAVGLSGPLFLSLTNATSDKALIFPALMTFLVAQSGLEFWQLGSEFWGLTLGLTLWGLQKLYSQVS